MRLLTGTSGYSYKEWKGPFYPEKLAAKDMLSYYAERLPAVEINNTFYRMPKRSVVESWRDQVPEGFRFSIKASRRITHQKRLKDAEDETAYLLETTAALGDRLGVLLFQLPPYLRCDCDRLARFLELLPEDTPAAFEFRHESWNDDAVAQVLRGRGAALVQVDGDDDEADDDALVATAGFGYLRLRRAGYERDALAGWARRIAACDWQQAFVFFKHEDAGAGPGLAAEFAELFQRQLERRGPLPAGAEADEEEAAGGRRAG